MSDISPTHSAVIELRDERRAMHEGYVFLDEKSLLLAGEMVQQLRRYEALLAEFERAQQQALAALKAAVGRHGLQGLQVYPAASLEAVEAREESRSVMGVWLREVELRGETTPQAPAVHPSPEAEECRRRFVELQRLAAPLAALAGNLERLMREYRRTSRRARALHDVLLPELDQDVRDVETRLEELEQEEAGWIRAGGVRR